MHDVKQTCVRATCARHASAANLSAAPSCSCHSCHCSEWFRPCAHNFVKPSRCNCRSERRRPLASESDGAVARGATSQAAPRRRRIRRRRPRAAAAVHATRRLQQLQCDRGARAYARAKLGTCKQARSFRPPRQEVVLVPHDKKVPSTTTTSTHHSLRHAYPLPGPARHGVRPRHPA